MGFFADGMGAGSTIRFSSPWPQARHAAAPKATAPSIKGKKGIPGTTAIMAISRATVPKAPG